MKDLQKRRKITSLERKCCDRVERLKASLEAQLLSGISNADLWEKAVSFFAVRKTPLFHNGYSRYSRETLRLFSSPADDVAPLCFQQ